MSLGHGLWSGVGVNWLLLNSVSDSDDDIGNGKDKVGTSVERWRDWVDCSPCDVCVGFAVGAVWIV